MDCRCSEYCIVRLIALSGKKNRRSKAQDECRKMYEKVKFGFGDENGGAALGSDIEEIVYALREVRLAHDKAAS